MRLRVGDRVRYVGGYKGIRKGATGTVTMVDSPYVRWWPDEPQHQPGEKTAFGSDTMKYGFLAGDVELEFLPIVEYEVAWR